MIDDSAVAHLDRLDLADRSDLDDLAALDGADGDGDGRRELGDVPAVEVIATLAVHLMTAAAVQLGLEEPAPGAAPRPADLDEARKLITALAGLVTAAAPEVGSQHAAPLRDGLRTLQLAFREASVVPDTPGAAPGEKYTGPVLP